MARAKNKRRTDGRFVSNITHEGKRYYVYGASLKECDERREELRRSLEQGLDPAELMRYYKTAKSRALSTLANLKTIRRVVKAAGIE